jgi:hypothetical protein
MYSPQNFNNMTMNTSENKLAGWTS